MEPTSKSELLLKIQQHIETIESLEARCRKGEEKDLIVADYTNVVRPSLERDLNDFLEFVPSSDPDIRVDSEFGDLRLMVSDARIMVTSQSQAHTICGQLDTINRTLRGLVDRDRQRTRSATEAKRGDCA
ncbi:MAG TPA: hypothetical protein PKJ41_02355 [Bryobacteraceae bacterium]|nr:hypothetical protein [Bryobacteraceae bacterium]HPT28731.1 hypothetical protein [Bryobacteraceae bacterium]